MLPKIFIYFIFLALLLTSCASSSKTVTSTTTNTNENTYGVTQYYAWQVAIYDTQEAAEKTVESYKNRNIAAKVYKRFIDGMDKYLVTVGRYSSKKAAELKRTWMFNTCHCKPELIEIE